MYPRVEINLEGILHNLHILRSKCEEQGSSLSLVTKVLGGRRQLVKYITEISGITSICDSRVYNLAYFYELDVEKWLIRSPMISEAETVVKYADVSLNSELKVIEALNETAIKHNKKHKIVLMCECGDLREGCYEEELLQIIEKCRTMDGIEIYGIGTNLSCLNEVLPSEENMAEFVRLVEKAEECYGSEFRYISGGASSSIPMLFSGKLDKKINHLRFGEAVFLGNIPVYDKPFENAEINNFILQAEVIELKEKPASPEIPRDDCTNLRKRAIVAVGKQDIDIKGLSVLDERIEIVAGSSDHVVLDVTNCGDEINVGSIISFRMNYNCLLNAMTSPYIKEHIV
ncbi:MAG: alanine racemase [Clostridia bacterium]|nr:alanine racemase [Clostridia bacterium]